MSAPGASSSALLAADAPRRRAAPRRPRWLLSAGALALLLLVATGCREKSRSAPEGILRVSQRNEPTDLDPATASLPDEFFIIRALGEGLLVPNPAGGAPLPGAAAAYRVSDDGLTYTFQLRPGLQWSNGEPLTAADFLASFRRVLTRATAAPKAHLFYAVKNAEAFVWGQVTAFDQVGFAAPDPRTVVVTLAHPNPSFPLYVASGPWIPVNPRAVAQHGRHWTAPGRYVGNGPYVLTEWRSQRRIVVRRNPRYHAPAPVPTAEIQFIRFDNQDTEDRAYRAGQIDVTMAVPPSKLEPYAVERAPELHRAPLAETRFLAFNTTRAPLSDARVRRALALAIDRDKLVTYVLRGGQHPATRYLSPALLAGSVLGGERGLDSAAAGQPPHPDSPSPLSYDPTESRRLLAQAGFPNGRGFPALELAGWVQNPVLDAIQQMWRQELGIEVRIVVQEAKVHLAAINAGAYDIAFVTSLLDVCDPVAALTDFTTGAPNNFPHWSSPAFDEAVQRASRTADPRPDILTAESLLLESGAVAPVYFNVQNWMMSTRVEGWQQDALWSRRYNEVIVEGD
ncbi:peptide ABC transporter substrate-binding protein [Opitutus sp. ER46]|uniref:peptide ABC transporter substrate-binding protein n=1 Tax=Opitutus sp. ER46 TaxID=2161864 RepID=UPI000D2FC6DD|nr:peptide ABC transporter substrate-binding protein [Opitutus sp. ER46]PTX92548.1 hypothetical protein DB354_14560 [Opitutus sp. ER46]